MRTTCSCGTAFEAKRPTAKYCSDRCRKRAQRKPSTGKVIALGVVQAPAAVEVPPVIEAGPLEAAARAELESVDRAETLSGGVVLALARRIDNASIAETGSAFAALTKELRAALAAAVAGAQQEDDGVDQVRKQRERKQRGRTG